MNNELPLVSCIMPTANRDFFVPIAIRNFLKQDYPNKELIIVDDGNASVKHLIPFHQSVLYTHLGDVASTIGAKRNIACEIAKGEIVMHWDDDDWYAGNWISHQVGIMQATNAAICGLSQMLFYSPLSHKCWRYDYPKFDRPWVGGATLAYKREFWRLHPFKNIQVGEDNQFIWTSGGKVQNHDYVDGFVSILHGKNTSPKHVNSSRWQKIEVSKVANAMSEDFRTYSALIENQQTL